MEKYFPVAGKAFKSGSKVFEKERLKVFSPAKAESTMNKAADPMTITKKVIKLMMFTAFWLLFERR